MRKGKAANIAQIAAEEKFRRQTEIMEQQTAKISELQQENTMLLLRQRKIQKSTDQADDDELSQVLNGLYQELEGWANRHFPQGDTHAQNSCWIYGAVSCLIFSFYLLKFWIGMSNTEEELIASHKIQSISAEVQKMFPSYIRQHFFAAISKAAVSINNESLRASVDYLAELVESKVGNQSPTCQQKRREQLKTLIWKFVEFKARLECQVNRYMIGQFRPSTSFNEKKMISFGGQSGADIVVDYTLSQALYKLSVDGDPILLLKARVSTRQASEHAKFATNPMYAAERWMNV
ncbi:hypothetical protein N7481_003739 [Penicillium waksmanii]|uniref:uncharacterized protein n=1 Tax=Penicillium waksmanii TaxID=69791 RepID=UPI0025471326|nr:uncharacterized protein N7481_003739 [Penicillium waksmanii]KAJ5988529.1 hypothetical protein N7481_003739 [Penicillium waksmanii]